MLSNWRRISLPLVLALAILTINTTTIFAGGGKEVFVWIMKLGHPSDLMVDRASGHLQVTSLMRSHPEIKPLLRLAYPNGSSSEFRDLVGYEWNEKSWSASLINEVPVKYMLGDDPSVGIEWYREQCFRGPQVHYEYEFETGLVRASVINTTPEILFLKGDNFPTGQPAMDKDLVQGQLWSQEFKGHGKILILPQSYSSKGGGIPQACAVLWWNGAKPG